MGRPVTHWQIMAKDINKQAAFYGALFDWKATADKHVGYLQVDTRSDRGISGGFWPAGTQGQPSVQLFIEVDDVPACVAQATALGASVVVPPTPLPEGATLAVLRDPEGVSFGLTSPPHP
jgi:predicted enzyme related to lactoylglutathione lyase